MDKLGISMYLPYQPTKEIQTGNNGAVFPVTCFDPHYRLDLAPSTLFLPIEKISCNVSRSGASRKDASFRSKSSRR